MVWYDSLRKTTLWIGVLLIWTLTPAREAASFYGSSHLKVPLQDARSTTDIYLKFRTLKPDALIFLAAGSIDYCLLVLEGGEIKVRINLGAGEAVLTSPPGLRLDDLLWHDVELHRTDADLNLIVDSIHSTFLDIPGRFFELNIKFGIFIGGLGGFSELFLGNIPNFRGCIDDIVFNDRDILAEAKENSDHRSIFSISWDCSEEFEALSHQPISFIDPGSFVALPGWNARNGASISLDVKTQSHIAVLFYKSGVSSKTDFVAAEILNGKVALSVNEGNGVVVLQSEITVNDGLWHHIDTQFSPSYIELDVDGQVKNLRPGMGENRFFDLAGFFYLGGVEMNKQSRALQSGLESILSEGMESSLKGCLKNVKINNDQVGLREAEITQGIQPDCVWDYPCVQDPCIEEAECYQDGLDSFRCLCERDVCVRTNFTSGYKLFTKSSLPIDLEILTLHPLVIAEGGSDLITSDHIQVILDFQKYGVRESGVLFHIIDPPKHGALEIAVIRGLADNIFTLLDINTDKVRYSHDGSESKGDSVVIEIEFRANNFRLPPFLEERHRFVFHVQITPVNDPPMLKQSPGKVLRLAKYTKKTLTRDVLEAEDPDNMPRDLVYTVLNLNSGEGVGFVENAKNPGKPAHNFTQQDVDDGIISYVHRGEPNTRLALRVSDGIEAGQTANIRIATFDLVVSLINNTGIILPYDSYSLISADNLTFSDNSPDQNLEIRYEITKLPQYGSIQRLRNNNRWHTVNHFTQRQLKKEKLRYIHTSGRPPSDEFRFTISCMDLKIPTVYDFRITFIAINLTQVNNKELVLDKKLDGHITESQLKFQTFPIATSPDLIIYRLISSPSFGSLIQFQAAAGAEHRHKKLEKGATFSQHDINSKHIKYKLHRKSYSEVHDVFTFRVECPGRVTSELLEFNIRHIPSETDAIIVNERLSVLEGGESPIGSTELDIQTPDAVYILYNVTSPPKHGFLKLLNEALTEIEAESPASFTSEHISGNRLIYVHDDSESDRDSFHFIAYPAFDRGSEGFVYYGTLHINVIMKNDNPPIRVVDKVFNVVLDGERKLTGQDLRYIDADIDSKPSDIQYTRRIIPNGALFHVDNMETQVYQFTQVDLDSGNIIFRHNGPAYAKAVLRITDGKFYATGILEIQASKPFMKITCNTGLVVKRGENGLLSASNLTVETNVNDDPGEITYKITSSPKHGEILINGRQANEFTQKDLLSENVEYENDNSVAFLDYISFSAFLGDNNVEGTFEFRIFPEVYWEPLKILNNKTSYVEEEKVVTIDSSTLSIVQANISPDNISYLVTSAPSHGFMMIGDADNEDDWKSFTSALPVTSFTQSTINENKLHYVNTERNVTLDSITFDVTNGITILRDLQLVFCIISKVILLRTSNITVTEGSEVLLRYSDIGVANPYYYDWITDYLVIEQPQHGYITNARMHGSKLNTFLTSQLKGGSIFYIHDGTETSRDWFTLVARAYALDKESSPSTIHVLVEPVNDETPHVVNNTGLDMWEGDIATITSQHLAAVDEDSGPEEVSFVISSPSNGYVALRNDTKTPILSFTQEQINRGYVVFIHTGEKAGGFRIQVNDGVNFDSPHVFTVTSRVLEITVLTNEKLTILPRMQQSITKDHLFAGTNDRDQNREVLFKVTKGPTLGRILKENPDGSLAPVSQFTQDQVNKNLIVYEHTQQMSGLTATDVVTLDVESVHAETIKDLKFEVEISVGNFGSGNLDQMVQLHTIEVQEGGAVPVGQEHIDLTRLLSLWQGKGKSEFAKKLKIVVHIPPLHGWLEMDGYNFTSSRRKSFSRDDIRKKKVLYHHDDSETFADNFSLGFYLADQTGYPDILLFNGTINVTVLPVNDRPFEILTKTSLLEVVQGKSVTLTPQYLSVADADGVPRDIVYEIIIPSKSGKLVLDERLDTPVNRFTQEDINLLRVRYFHDGTKENRSGYHFKVSDGKHKPDYAVLNIIVIPVTLELVNKSIIEVEQGSTVVFFSYHNLGAATNAGREVDIWYNVTSAPSHGHIFVNDDVVRQFRQTDIDNERVFYMQSDLSFPDDYFIVTIKSGKNVIANEVINITVVPLVKQKSLTATVFGTTRFSLDVLDATKLAEQTGSNPKYVVVNMPKFGVLKKTTGSNSRPKRKSQKNFEFTHEDIAQKYVVYEAKEIDISDTIVDSFDYILSAPQVQPAKGRFFITLQPRKEYSITVLTTEDSAAPSVKPTLIPIIPESKIPTTTSSGTSEEEVYKPAIGNDYLLIIGVVLGIVFVALLILIVIRCRVLRREERKNRAHHLSNSICQKEGKVHGSHTAQSDLDMAEHLPSNGSISLSDDLPPPPPPTSPSSTGSRGGCIGGGGTPKQRNPKSKPKRSDADPALPPPPYVLENGEWTEVTSSLPTCKVTPISHGELAEQNETTLKTPYIIRDHSEAGESEDWSRYDGPDLRYGLPGNPVLRKNQYWV